MWIAGVAAISLLMPVIALAGKLGGGLILILCFCGVAGTGIVLIGYSIRHAWELRQSPLPAALSAAIPMLAIVFGLLLIPILAELSWQTIYGPRDVDIWPY